MENPFLSLFKNSIGLIRFSILSLSIKNLRIFWAKIWSQINLVATVMFTFFVLKPFFFFHAQLIWFPWFKQVEKHQREGKRARKGKELGTKRKMEKWKERRAWWAKRTSPQIMEADVCGRGIWIWQRDL